MLPLHVSGAGTQAWLPDLPEGTVINEASLKSQVCPRCAGLVLATRAAQDCRRETLWVVYTAQSRLKESLLHRLRCCVVAWDLTLERSSVTLAR